MLNPLLNDQVNLTTIKDCDLPEIESLRQVDQNLRNLASDNSLWREKADEIGCPIEAGGSPGSIREQVIKYIVDLRQKVNELFIEKLYVPFPKKGMPTIADIKAFKKVVDTQDPDCLISNLSREQKVGYNIIKNQFILSKIISMSIRVIGGAITGAIIASRYLYLTPERAAALVNEAMATCYWDEKCSSSEIASLGVAEWTAEIVREEFEDIKNIVSYVNGIIILSSIFQIISNKMPRTEWIKWGIVLTLYTSIYALLMIGPKLKFGSNSILRGVAARAEITGALAGVISSTTSYGIFSAAKLTTLFLLPLPNLIKTWGLIHNIFDYSDFSRVLTLDIREKISSKISSVTEAIRTRVHSIGQRLLNLK